MTAIVIGLGCRVPSTGRYFDALLGGDPLERTPTVAGQGPNSDGFSYKRHLISVVRNRDFAGRRNRHETFCSFNYHYRSEQLQREIRWLFVSSLAATCLACFASSRAVAASYIVCVCLPKLHLEVEKSFLSFNRVCK